MQNRTLKFRAFLNVADKIKVVLEEVTIYPDGMQGMSYDDFVNDVQGVGYNFDGDHFSKANDSEAELIEGYKYNVLTGDDWIFFEGTPLQFTGLKDNNGKEVYEGDIVKGVIKHPFASEGKREIGQVIYSKQEARFCVMIGEEDNCGYTGLQQYGGNFEIIGNIYEHPELLNP